LTRQHRLYLLCKGKSDAAAYVPLRAAGKCNYVKYWYIVISAKVTVVDEYIDCLFNRMAIKYRTSQVTAGYGNSSAFVGNLPFMAPNTICRCFSGSFILVD
jgi:hypothetical protein